MFFSSLLLWLCLAASVHSATLKPTLKTTSKNIVPTVAKTLASTSKSTIKTSTIKTLSRPTTIKTSIIRTSNTISKALTSIQATTTRGITSTKAITTGQATTSVAPIFSTGSSSTALTFDPSSTTVTAPLAAGTGATTAANTTLVPISKPCNSTGACNLNSVVPRKNVTLSYGLNNNPLVQIALTMNHSTIVLEDISSVQKVHCDLVSKSVAITFNNSAEFITVTGHWSALVDNFVLITNHLGDCDSEFERGFFLADVSTMAVTTANMTVRVFAEQTDALSTGQSIDLTFNDMPALEARHEMKRGIHVNKDGLTIGTNVNLDATHFTVTADHAQINSSVTYSGALKYSMHKRKLTEFWIDVKKNIYHDLGLTFDFRVPYVYNLQYEIPVVSYFAVDIPGIINLGPELTLAIGIEIDVQAQVQVVTNFSSTITNGHAHVDFLDSSKTEVTNWKPIHTATANISESGSVTVTPNVAATIQLACSLFDSALDLSTGVTAMTGVAATFGATTTQAGVGTGNITLPQGQDCPNGFGYSLDYVVTITAFATSWLKRDFPVYDKPLGSWCMPWLSL